MAIIRFIDIIQKIIATERTLGFFYAEAQDRLKGQRSRKLIGMLNEEQGKHVEALEGIDLKPYRDSEFIKNQPEPFKDDLTGDVHAVLKETPERILVRILSFEEKLKEYYTHVRSVLAFEKDRELMDTLIQMKINQIKHIRGYIEDYNLVL